jgi:ribonucleoside-diphosphate reductase alpha chain
VEANDTIEGAPQLRDEHLSIFDCAFPSARGKRSIHYMGHVRMMAAAQPFLSGGISKTVNLPGDCTVEDIERAYVEGWKLGLKSLAVYRDGSKRTQPLNTRAEEPAPAAAVRPAEPKPYRRKLPEVRTAVTHKFSIAGHDGYLTVGQYEDGTPGELFLKMAKEGSTISGLMDTVAIMTSLALQYGVPLKAMVDKFSHTRFEPSGFTQNPEIPLAKSVVDYVFRWLGIHYHTAEAADANPDHEEAPLLQPAGSERIVAIRGGRTDEPRLTSGGQSDAPPCTVCGTITIRRGACYTCPSCGENGGCG